MSEELKYNEPWILQRADPYVYRHTDGNYYFTASIPAYDRIVLKKRNSGRTEGCGRSDSLGETQRRNHERTYLGAGASLSGW